MHLPPGKLERKGNKPLLADKADCLVKAFRLIDKYMAMCLIYQIECSSFSILGVSLTICLDPKKPIKTEVRKLHQKRPELVKDHWVHYQWYITLYRICVLHILLFCSYHYINFHWLATTIFIIEFKPKCYPIFSAGIKDSKENSGRPQMLGR